MMIQPEKCLQLYLAIKTHFTTEKYDAVKMNCKIKNADTVALNKRRDKGLIISMSRKFDTAHDASSFFVANCAYGNFYPFTDYDTGVANHTQWQKVRQSLTKCFRDDLDFLCNIGVQYDDMLNGMVPQLFTLYKNRKINIETIVILDHFDNFLDDWKDTIPVWKDDVIRIQKLAPFVKVTDKMSPIYTTMKEHCATVNQ